MKKYLLLVLTSAYFIVSAQLTSLNPFEDIDAFTSVTASGNFLLLGTDKNKIIRSTDAGGSWSKVEISIPTGINKLHHSGGAVFGVGNSGTVIKSTDYGLTWLALTTNTTSDLLDISSVNPFVIVACGSDGTILRTTDGGVSWSVSNPVAYRLNSVRFSTLLTGWVAGDDGMVIKTTDGGNSWNQVTGASGAFNYAVISLFGEDGIFLFGREGQAMVSTDGGLNWSYDFLPVYMVGDTVVAAWNYSRDTAVFADDGGGLSILALTPNGFRHGRYTGNAPILSKYFDVFRTEEKKFLAVGRGPSMSRLELNNTWTPLITMLKGRNLRFLKFSENGTGLVAGYQDGSNPDKSDIFVTSDRGVSWKLSTSTTYLTNLKTIPEGNFYITELYSWVSNDTGKTWRKLPEVSAIKRDLVFVDPYTGYCIDYNLSTPPPGYVRGRLYITRSSGTSWNTLKTYESYSIWKIFADKEGRLWITDNGSGIVNVSLDSGITVAEKYLPGFYTGDMAIGGNIGKHGYLVYDRARVFFTTNGGSSFTKTYENTAMVAQAVSNSIEGRSLIVGNNGKIIATTDHGATWQLLPQWTALNLTSVWLMPDLSFIVTTSTGEVLKGVRPGIFTGIENESPELPVDYTLGNYPNPFNGSTVIYFTLPADNNCHLEVFNSLGSLVLSEEIKGIRGENTFRFDATGMESGVYFYRVRTGGKSLTGKMVLLK
ncbi:MAG: T9SS type A sorting domain-containing protein [Ignavibacteriales bacterium]|nr:T9SS type A sorting domain-containing protein [Ignavibacteriales bacterium]